MRCVRAQADEGVQRLLRERYGITNMDRCARLHLRLWLGLPAFCYLLRP
jgi:hypothetical protein